MPAPVWLMAAVLLAAGASVLLKGPARGLPDTARAKVAAWTRAPEPEDTIWAAVDAAKAGNVPAYLALFAPPMRAQLAASHREMGEAAFRDYLTRTAAEPKGIAVSRLESDEGPQSARFRLEFVFGDRNEVQQYTLQQAGRRWQILRVDSAERVKTIIPYGTPVEQVFGRGTR